MFLKKVDLPYCLACCILCCLPASQAVLVVLKRFQQVSASKRFETRENNKEYKKAIT